MSNNGFTNVQRKMLAVLADGMPHSRYELHDCLYDKLGPISNIRKHITGIRKVLRPKGHEIICEFKGRTTWYRHVKLLASARRELAATSGNPKG